MQGCVQMASASANAATAHTASQAGTPDGFASYWTRSEALRGPNGPFKYEVMTSCKPATSGDRVSQIRMLDCIRHASPLDLMP